MQALLVALARRVGLSARARLDERLRGERTGRHRVVHPLDDGTLGLHLPGRIANQDESALVGRAVGDFLRVGDEFGRILPLYIIVAEPLGEQRMGQECVEQVLYLRALRDDAVEVEDVPDGEGIFVRVEETAAADVVVEVAREEVCLAFVRADVEALVDDVAGHVDDGFHTLEPLVGFLPIHQPRFAGEFGVHAVGGHDEVGSDGVEFFAGDADDLTLLAEQSIDRHLGEQAAAGLTGEFVDLLCHPRVHLPAQDGVGPLGVLLVTLRDVEGLDLLAGDVVDVVVRDWPFGRVLAKARQESVDGVGCGLLGVDESPRDVLRAGIDAPFQYHGLDAVTCERRGRRGSPGTRADHHRLVVFVLVSHRFSLHRPRSRRYSVRPPSAPP